MIVTKTDIILSGLAIVCTIAFLVYIIWINKDDDGDGMPQCGP